MQVIKGDLVQLLIEGRFDVAAHGCNCFHKMGAGIAKTLSLKLPEVLEADKATPYAEKKKLGSYSVAPILRFEKPFTVLNCYTQFRYGRGIQVDYSAIDRCFERISVQLGDRSIAFPKIGAGLAGGDWDRIEEIIYRHLNQHNATLVVL